MSFPQTPQVFGVPTGKYRHTSKPPANIRTKRGDVRNWGRDIGKETIQVIDKIKKHLAKRSITPDEFAIRRGLNDQIVPGVRPGTLGQWEGYLGTLKHEFTTEDQTFCDSLVALRAVRRHRASSGPATSYLAVNHVACSLHDG
ncbi:MAG: hypothetical protein VYE18_05970 [Pseudomonadota bacterium]|nr:hypothetical protein [Pseudomonadota bacterium]